MKTGECWTWICVWHRFLLWQDVVNISIIDFCKIVKWIFLLSEDTRARRWVCWGLSPVHVNICGVWLIPSIRLFRLNVNFCKSIDPSILRGLIFASTDMTSLGAILVIGKLEGLTREGGRGDLTFSCSEPKLFFRIMWPLRFSISDCRILLNFSTFCVSAQPHMEGFMSVTHIDTIAIAIAMHYWLKITFSPKYLSQSFSSHFKVKSLSWVCYSFPLSFPLHDSNLIPRLPRLEGKGRVGYRD